MLNYDQLSNNFTSITEDITNKLNELNGLLYKSIENGTNSIEKFHKSVANIPFNILDKVNFSHPSFDKIQNIQDKSIADAYELVRVVNNKFNKFSTDILKKEKKTN